MLNAKEKEALRAELASFVGRPVGPPVAARDPVNEPMIRQWCDAMGDANPSYLDPEAAAAGVHGELVAPPLMLQAWIMEGWAMHEGYDTPRNEEQRLHKRLTDAGYSGVLGTDTEQGFTRYLRLGERVQAETVIEEISEEKATGVGVGFFITTRTRFTVSGGEEGDGEEVGWMSFRVFKFIPKEAPAEGAGADAKAPARPARIKPPMGHDNAWWWNKIAEGKIELQRCSACERLRHPPRPMCAHCRSMEWDSVPISGRGTLHTYTVIHHPQFPGYEFPILAVLVDLEEGERIVSNVVGVAPGALEIGMKLEAFIHEDEDGFKLPLFRPAS